MAEEWAWFDDTGLPREKLPVELVLDGAKLDELVCKHKDKVVVAMFTSPTCAACMVYKPIFYAYAAKARELFGDRVKFVEVDVYHAYEKAIELGIMGTPTTVIFKKCSVADGFVGIVDEESLHAIISEHVS